MKDCHVGNAPFFSALSKAEQDRISERMHPEVRRRGDALFRKGDPSDALYLIKSGWVRLLAEGGIVIASLGPGDLVGETDVFLSSPRSIGATVASDAELMVLTDRDLVDLIAENPQTGFDLGDAFGTRLALLDRFLVERRLKGVPSLAGLSDSLLTAIAHHLYPVNRRQGEIIFDRGDTPQGLFLIESGRVQVEGPAAGSGLVDLGPGQTLGEMALLTGTAYRHAAQAGTDVALWSLPAAEFEALALEFPQLRKAISTHVQETLTAQDREQAAEKLAKLPLFAGQPREVLLAAAERMVVRYAPAGEMIFSDGAPGDSLYLIDSGQVEITTSARPRSEVLARLRQDQFFGEMALLTGEPRTTAARAASNANLWALKRSDFEDLVSRYPSLSLALNRVLGERLSEVSRRYSESQLRHMKLLSGMSSSQLHAISRRLREVRFRRGQAIVREGELGDELYLVASGRMQVSREGECEAYPWADLGAGDVVGEFALLTGNPHAETVTALSDVNGWALGKADFDELVAVDPSLALALSRVLSERLHATGQQRVRAAAVAMPVAAAPRAAARAEPIRREWAAPPREVAVPVRRERAVRPREAAGPSLSERGAGLLAGLKAGLANLATWFRGLTPGARVRLVLIALLLVWLVGIAIPAFLIQVLAADNVRDLTGAIAFVQRETTVQAAAAVTAEAQVEAVLRVTSVEAGAQVAPFVADAAVQAPAVEPTVEPTQAPPTAVPATATPFIIIVTNTPAPATDTPVPTATPKPKATAKPKPVAAAAAPALPTQKPATPRELDPRLPSLHVVLAEPGGLTPGQTYFRLVRVQWQDEKEAQGDHTIYIEVLDESGARMIGQGVQIDWAGGSQIVYTENKPPTEYPANFPMYATLGAYQVSIAGQPSDRLQGLGLGTIEAPGFKVHTNFKLVYQRTTW